MNMGIFTGRWADAGDCGSSFMTASGGKQLQRAMWKKDVLDV